jgi:hypothetical protein
MGKPEVIKSEDPQSKGCDDRYGKTIGSPPRGNSSNHGTNSIGDVSHTMHICLCGCAFFDLNLCYFFPS